jgi:hypothetical protein
MLRFARSGRLLLKANPMRKRVRKGVTKRMRKRRVKRKKWMKGQN